MPISHVIKNINICVNIVKRRIYNRAEDSESSQHVYQVNFCDGYFVVAVEFTVFLKMSGNVVYLINAISNLV